jgi:hypothetical protein
MTRGIVFQTGRPALALNAPTLSGPTLSGTMATSGRAGLCHATVPARAPKHGPEGIFRAVPAQQPD